MGLDLDDTEAVQTYRVQVIEKHQRDLRELIKGHRPHATVFFNGTTDIRRGVNFPFVPGDHFWMDNYLHISYSLADDYVNEGLRRIYETIIS